MSGIYNDQLHRSTLGIYSNLIDEFNPSLLKLVSLGNCYAQAFKALAVTSQAYFSALSKFGERAFKTVSSRSLGEVMIQLSDNQQRLFMELEDMFRWFSMEVLLKMDNNVQLDRDYLSDSRVKYEMNVRSLAAAAERQMRRGNGQDYSEYEHFVRKSHGEAVKEEERRFRFLAEKHCGLIQTIAQIMNKTGGNLQQKLNGWTDDISATRQPEVRQPPSQEYPVDEIRRSRDEHTLGKIPSRAPSPQGSIYRSGADSGGGGSGGRPMRAKVAHQPAGSNPTLLPFSRGQIITVLVQQPRNGWLYGRGDGSSRQGWFPVSYVEALDDPPMSTISRNSSLRSRSNMSMDKPDGAPAPAPPPPPPLHNLSSHKHPESRPGSPTTDTPSERQRSQGPRPNLFPRGTNPFATVKLKPTATNDRSAPRLHRQ
ncbi:brain-specific angiogenesis inhibitor 1-associated protein 2-like protein 2 [Cololabis saira]|uniref:brain-specific angiogenesis inhibitor 1-associated protein 2-like protein 2 n=1 Tax=Cololabis saira TaxID=129043 RepID=UPI002AD4E6B1|nr:brain-specific angiogenesis inhibitor 1-associated protein 2-like protein 2 [Cololabis saira]